MEVIAFRLDRVPVTLRLDLPSEPLRVRAGPVRFQQVVVNLVSNALDALEDRPDGTIHIEGRREGNRVLLTVRDNGPGIPQGLEDRIFDPFFSTKGVGSGLGLGLSISFNIIKDFGGELRILPTERGAAFCIDLPGGES